MNVFLVNFAELVFLPAFVGLTKHMHSLPHPEIKKKKFQTNSRWESRKSSLDAIVSGLWPLKKEPVNMTRQILHLILPKCISKLQGGRGNKLTVREQ
jgi:hypothetical protein